MTYIIGAGVTGQIAKRMFPDAIMIAEKVSGKPIPFWFMKTPQTQEMFNKYFGGYTEKLVTLGYDGNEYEKYNHLTHKKKGNLPCDLMHSMIVLEPKQDFVFREPDIKDTIVYICSNTMAGKLGSYKVDAKEKVIWTGQIDNTEFYDKKYKVHYNSVTYYYFQNNLQLFPEDTLYLLTSDMLDKSIYRITKVKVDSTADIYSYYVEISGKVAVNKKKFYRQVLEKKFGISIKKAKFFCIEKAQAFSEEPIIDTQNTVFVGRFAQCDHNIKTEDSVKKLMEMKL